MASKQAFLLFGAVVLAFAPSASPQTSGFVFSYGTTPDTTQPLASGGTVNFSQTPLNASSQVSVTVTNSGAKTASVASVTLAGTDFQLSSTPLPNTNLNPGTSVTFLIVFTPKVAGPRSGTLQVVAGGAASAFALTGIGLGPAWTVSYTGGSTITMIHSNDSIVFPSTAVGIQSGVHVSVLNSGTATGVITSIGLSNVPQFSLANLANLPASIDPGATIAFDIDFSPNNTGVYTALLKLDASTFTLSAVGTAPPPLPAYEFEGQPASPGAFQQATIGLTLASPYALAIQGTLTLAYASSAFTIDPAVQFSTGNRIVNFTVPANSTHAIFSNNSNQVQLQTGTVASTITVTPSFSLAGGYDLKPGTPAILSWTIPEASPDLVSVKISGAGTNAFTIELTGFSTARTLSTIHCAFSPAAGSMAQAVTVTIDAEQAFSAWYGSAASQQFGSQFTATVPFTMQSNPASTSSSNSYQSVTVSLSNSLGTSKSLSANLSQ